MAGARGAALQLEDGVALRPVPLEGGSSRPPRARLPARHKLPDGVIHPLSAALPRFRPVPQSLVLLAGQPLLQAGWRPASA